MNNSKTAAQLRPLITTQAELNFDKQTYTRAEVIALLEDVYMETAGSYNDYNQRPSDYIKEAEAYVEKYMKDK